MIEIQTVLSIAALGISLGVFLLSRKSFIETYRPVITAEIKTHSSGNEGIFYSLVVRNIGTRPACEIALISNKEKIKAIINENAEGSLVEAVYRCFSDQGVIQVLVPNESTLNSFGATGSNTKNNILINQARLPIKIKYKDLNGKNYESCLVLIVKDSTGFAGSYWSEQNS